ncbi:hypothetical protein DFS34DRAFT_635372 [Phlyctochytrium arcticum]|nr:hypothetical protein DFS34DRAFT_635372 [Phlyctochytrium arcticum]
MSVVRNVTDLPPTSYLGHQPLRILVASEYLPPYVSGIANRFKNLIKGYRDEGHVVTVASVAGAACDIVVPSLPNPFYPRQRMFACPPLYILGELLNPFRPVPYDVLHMVTPLCLAFWAITPLFWLRGVKIYISYHVYMEYYKQAYFMDKNTWYHRLAGNFINLIYTWVYIVPMVFFADLVGIPSKTADSVISRFARKIHFMKSGLDTDVFTPSTNGTMNSVLRRGASLHDLKMEQEEEKADGPEYATFQPRGMDQEFLPPYSVNERPISPGSSSFRRGPTMVYIGRLAPEKNVEFLISCLADPLLANATLVIVGDGPSRSDLKEVADATVGSDAVFSNPAPSTSTAATSAAIEPPFSALALSSAIPASTSSHRVIFTGMVLSEREIAAYYAHADIFVSASASETFGFTVAEALACGTPSVMVRAGAFKSVYRELDDWMFEEHDTHDFVQKVIHCFQYERETARVRARRIAVDGFGINMAVKDLLSAYCTIANDNEETTHNANVTSIPNISSRPHLIPVTKKTLQSLP